MANVNTPVRPPVPAREELEKETAFIPVPDPAKLPAQDFDIPDSAIHEALAKKDYAQASQLVQLRDSFRALKAERAALERKHREQVQSLRAVEDELQRRLQTQDECLHIKENRKTALVAIKDSKGTVHYLCQQCQKHWENHVPEHLRAGIASVGGPA